MHFRRGTGVQKDSMERKQMDSIQQISLWFATLRLISGVSESPYSIRACPLSDGKYDICNGDMFVSSCCASVA